MPHSLRIWIAERPVNLRQCLLYRAKDMMWWTSPRMHDNSFDLFSEIVLPIFLETGKIKEDLEKSDCLR